MTVNFSFVVICFWISLLGSASASSGSLNLLSQTYEEGKTPWMLIPDDRGFLHLAIFNKNWPQDSRDIAEDVKYLLFKRSSISTPYRLYVNDVENLKGSEFDPSLSTKILIHGFGSSASSSTVEGIKNAYLKMGEYNIIGVDWGVLCPSPNYGTACTNAKLVGSHLAELIEFLVTQSGAKLEDFHIIGHSLGAQVAGFAGAGTKSGKVARVTGLDAAYPMFGNANDTGRLDGSDGVLVDSIHTCGGSLGFRDPFVQVDFYPNGGTRPQPGCGEDITGSCSHGKSVTYFIESIENPEAFSAIECLSLEEAESGKCTGTNTGSMGDSISFGRSGLYYVDTTK